ncbi:MAG: ABC transporter permease [Deinococcales bacterium]
MTNDEQQLDEQELKAKRRAKREARRRRMQQEMAEAIPISTSLEQPLGIKGNIQKLFSETWQDMRKEASLYRLGFFWWILEPILLILGFYIIFGIGLRGAGREGDFLPFLMTGILIWQWIPSIINNVANRSVRRHQKKEVEPTWYFVMKSFTSNTLEFILSFVLLLTFLLMRGYHWHLGHLFLPLLLLTQACYILGVSFITAILVPRLPDLQPLISSAVRFLFFMSGIIYDIEHFDNPQLQQIFYLNPLALLIKAYREVLIDGKIPHHVRLGFVVFGGVILLAIGLWLLRKERGVAENPQVNQASPA